MSARALLYYYAAKRRFRDLFFWDGYSMSHPAGGVSPNRTRRFTVRQSNVGASDLDNVTADDEGLSALDTWDNTDNPQLFHVASDLFFLWNGGTTSDYTYVVSETRTGSANPATNFLSNGSHPSSDFTSGATSSLECSTVGTAARWELEIAVTHTPSGLVRTGTLIFEFS